jgi:exosortase
MTPEAAVKVEIVTGHGISVGQRHEAAAALVAVCLLFLWRGIHSLFAYSLVQESSSHMILIPFISLTLIYVERKTIFQTVQAAPLPGLIAIFSGIALYLVIDRPGSAQYLSVAALSIVLILAGSFLLCYGSRATAAAAFPLAFLLLMVPMSDAFLGRTIHLLQEGSTAIAYGLFKVSGVPVLRDGFLLYLPKVTIEVATECSGIRSSVALLITCLLAAHLFLRTYWKMALFVALAFPLAIVKNGIRITTLTLLSMYVDPGFLSGSLHRDGGIVFFLLALAILAPILLLMQKAEDRQLCSAVLHKTGTQLARG